jgi:purine-binding chemotaxis protein CheW
MQMTLERNPSAAGATGTKHAGKYLTFFLQEEEYGLEILKVHEIIGMMPITPVPRTPDFIRGVINLRGKIIPTLDLRLKFGMAETETTDQTCIIVVQSNGMQIGVVVDRVSEVLDIASEEIEDTPSFGSDVNTDYILGIGKSEGRVRLLLDIDRALSGMEIDGLTSMMGDA